MVTLQLSQTGATLLSGIGIFLAITLLLVIVLLIAKHYLVSSGQVTVTINHDKKVDVASGGPLLSALATKNVFLPSACGGKGSCGQCKVQVTE
ncbi:MAG: 2Fe-2S iron-sulfur cluster binding domain-containing protein, partial [Muribaculaceae bacterium]|nr:2Fe-2S iron-sulfur cluster binding domain-containing protein [Muribaculaceae bacterium]